ncbi:hypothetical protein DH2020_043317 [Rehmannia glutinosa]|uniref:GDSL esterase/lipase n=1 Tax=Rehmannia glutinosa TaxID=99300 RepID=A0ABR0ULT3_REHGL
MTVAAGDATLSEKTTKCPFRYLYHFGDGVTDIGNSIRVMPWFDMPAKKYPYGKTYPGWPTGRWSDGLVDFDYTAMDFGLPFIVPYLSMDRYTRYDGVIFSVARSPVLDHSFFKSKGVVIPPYAVSLSGQMNWFRKYLQSICLKPKDCVERLENSLILMGDIEGNDIGYLLTQGKTILEVRRYVPLIIKTMIESARELIRLGAARIIIPGKRSCWIVPYILTALQTNDSTAYDDIGCLKTVNDFIVWKNNNLQDAIENLKREFPKITIYYGDMYDGVRSIIANASIIGNMALKSCCGIGGKYNYNSKRVCGDKGVPVCPSPDNFIYWDGIHFTQQAYYTMEHLLVQPALGSFNCTSKLLSAVM